MVKQRRKLERNPKLSKTKKLTLNLGVAGEQDLIIPKDMIEFFKSNIKINGKKGNLGENVGVVSVKGKKIDFQCNVHFSKKYIKYLTKKYLKKNDILDYFKINRESKNSYVIKFVKNEVEDE